MTSTDDAPTGYALSVTAVALASFLLPLAVTAPSTALADIGRSLQAGPVSTQWLVNGYAIAFAAAVLPAGSIADRVGRRRVLRGGSALFACSSALIAAAPDILVADLVRIPEAIGAAAILASGAAVLSATAVGARRARAFGLLGASFGAGLALGPVLAGVLAPVGWRAIFGAIAVLGLGAVWLGRWSRESNNPAGDPIDLPGMMLFTGALLALSVAFVEAPTWGWGDPATLGLMGVAVLLIAAFANVERRRRTPMFDVRLFGQPSFVAITCQPFTITFGFVILLVFLPPFIEQAAGASVLGASLAMLPLTVPVVAIPLAARRLLDVVGIRGTLVVASTLISTGAGLLVRISANGSFVSLAPGLLAFGLGVGAAFAVMDNAAVGTAPVERAGAASGMFNTMRLTGEAIAISAAGAVLTSLTATRLPASAHQLAADAVQGRAAGGTVSSAVAGSLHVVAVALAVLAGIGAIGTFIALRPRATGQVRVSESRSTMARHERSAVGRW